MAGNEEALRQQLAGLQQLNILRGQIMLGMVIDGIEAANQAAAAGNPSARDLLEKLSSALASIPAARNGITLAMTPPAPRRNHGRS